MQQLRHILSIALGFTLFLAFSSGPVSNDIRSNSELNSATEWVARRRRYSSNQLPYSYRKLVQTNWSLLQYSTYQFASLLLYHNQLQHSLIPVARRLEFRAKTRKKLLLIPKSHSPANSSDTYLNL